MMKPTFEQAAERLANSLFFKGENAGFKLNDDGQAVINNLRDIYDQIEKLEDTMQRDEDGSRGHHVIGLPSFLYIIGLVIKANDEGVSAAALKGYLDLHEMMCDPEKFLHSNQFDKNLMIKAAQTVKDMTPVSKGDFKAKHPSQFKI